MMKPFNKKGKKIAATPTHDAALARLQKYCAYQDRCHQEVRNKLLELGMYGHDLEVIITELIEEKFLNEERFARSYARGKFRIKHWGKTKIKLELKRKNVSAYCIKKGLSEIDDDDYIAALQKVITKKQATTKAKNTYELKNKLALHAIRRGFESALAWEFINELIENK